MPPQEQYLAPDKPKASDEQFLAPDPASNQKPVLEGHGPVPTKPGWLDRDIPLAGSWINPTLKGIQNLGQAGRGLVQGVASTFGPRQPGENVFTADPGVRMLRGVGDLAGQALQLPGAIRDINASPDPLSHYADAASHMAAEGAVQALAGAATEGLAKAPPGTVSRLARTGGKAMRGAVEDIPVVRQINKLGKYWDETGPPKPVEAPASAKPYQQSIHAAPLRDIPATGAKPASVTGEALRGVKTGAPEPEWFTSPQPKPEPFTPSPPLRGLQNPIEFPTAEAGGMTPAERASIAKPPATASAKPVETVGTSAGASRDTALFKQARAELGEKASISEVAKRAQELKTQSPATASAKPVEAPGPIERSQSYRLGKSAGDPRAEAYLGKTNQEIVDEANKLKIDGRTNWRPEELKRTSARHGKFSSPAKEDLIAKLAATKAPPSGGSTGIAKPLNIGRHWSGGEGLKPVTLNASGAPGGGSLEESSALGSEKAAGVRRVVVDTRSGLERSILARDYTPQPYESMEYRGGDRDGEVIVQGDKARPYSRRK